MRNRILAVVAFALLSAPLSANHSWGGYHWARTTSSFDLIVVNSTTSDWDAYVDQATADWSASDKLNMVQDVNGDTSVKTRRQCRAPGGRVRICNLDYGYNGWLGVAGIYIDADGHIVKGYTKLNDTYFASAYYDSPDWRQAVTCQELGHDIGLDHQDENFDNDPLFSCMDYQDPPYAYPNSHDYEQLDSIYAHTDSYDSYDDGSASGDGGCNAPPGKGCNKGQAPGDLPDEAGWGISLGRHGQTERFLRIEPDGTRILTFVTWAIGN